MAEGSATAIVRKIVGKAEPYIPQIPKPKKKRKYLKCGVVFSSAHLGNRTCGSCASQNQRAPIRATHTFQVHK